MLMHNLCCTAIYLWYSTQRGWFCKLFHSYFMPLMVDLTIHMSPHLLYYANIHPQNNE